MEFIQVTCGVKYSSTCFFYYFNEAQVFDCSVVKGGLINKTYKLDTTEGFFILQQINQQVFKHAELALENIKRCLHG